MAKTQKDSETQAERIIKEFKIKYETMPLEERKSYLEKQGLLFRLSEEKTIPTGEELLLDLPIKCGQMFIKFDENNKPEYGFLCDDNSINKFINLSDQLPEYIVLPQINKEAYVPENQKSYDMAKKYGLGLANRYLNGNIKIKPEAFQGIKQACIVVTMDTSVMLDWGCFDDGAKIDFIIPENMGLHQVYRRFDTAFDYEYENWTLIAKNGIDYSIDEYKDSYSTSPFQPKNNRNVEFNISGTFTLDSKIEEPTL